MNRKQRRTTATQVRRSSPAAIAAGQAVDRALAQQRTGALAEAIASYRAALALDPNSVDAHMNLGICLGQVGVRGEALEHCRSALARMPGSARLQNDFAAALAQLGQWDEAIAAAQRAVALEPSGADSLATLGRTLTEVGRREEAAAHLRRACALSAFNAHSHFDLYRAVFDDRDLGPAVDALTKAVTLDGGLVWVRFSLGVALDLQGNAKAARQHLGNLHPDKAVFRGAVDSWEYAKAKRTAATRFFTTTRETLLFALEQATAPGAVLELGVRHGTSIRWLAERCPGKVHGFDCFEGLPEAWHVLPRGAYSTHGELPEVPANVELHVGLFDQTLPGFLERCEGPIRLMNVDCDLYSSTLSGLEAVADRVAPGAVLVFDEYLLNDAWRDDEFKAFQEVVARRGWTYDYLAFNLFTGQAVVRIG